MRFSDFDELSILVDKEGGLLTVKMHELRDARKYDRLGKYVIQEIQENLRQRGLEWFPADELPSAQYEEVRIVRSGTTLSRAVKAVRFPDPKGDELLKDLSNNGDTDKIKKIRAILDETY